MIGMIAAAVIATAAKASEVTVYNQGMGLIKETRTIALKAGRQNVAIEDVASMIDPTSVGIQSISDKGSFQVLEQNYQYDLISPQAILEKSVGQRIRFIRTLAGQRDVLEGTLISSPGSVVPAPGGRSQYTYNGMVIRTDDGRIVLSPSGEIEVKEVPAGLISKPTLVWDLDAEKAGENTVELSYITNGISWSSDYVLTLDGLGKAALQGWVTINNQCGATFENAKLKLLAGDVNRARGGGIGGGGFRDEAALSAAKQMNFEEQGLFEYHLYTLQRPATVRNHETKQISLLESPSITVQKRMIVDSMMNYGRYYPTEGEVGTGDIKPQVRIEFVNNKENGLGIPLPKGRVRLYQRDNSGSVQLLGEDNIDHTPKEEKVSLVVGRAFDVVSKRLRTNFVRLSPNSVQETFEIEVRNRKDTAEKVEVLERHYGDWRVTKQSMDFTKRDSETMEFDLNMKPNEVRKITYTVETRW